MRPAGAFVAAAALVALAATGVAPRPAVLRAVPDPLRLSVTGRLRVGVTLAAAAADPWGNPAAVASARRVLSAVPLRQAQALMGWGVGNPEPSPGVYDWSGLDRRMAAVAATGGSPVLTLAGAPDWMAGHAPGETDWHRLGEAPTPAHYRAFAALAAAAVERYPAVRAVLVWNELSGFWDARSGTWDIAAYTRLYNDVYRAVKAARPDVAVGGPYVVLASAGPGGGPPTAGPGPRLSGAWGTLDPRPLDALGYWLDHAVGADFVALDADAAPTWGRPVGAFTAVAKFAAVDAWVQARTALPIWWSEFYVEPAGASWSPGHQDAVVTAALAAMSDSGAAVALLWGPEADGQAGLLPYLWTSTARAGGGRPTPLAAGIAAFDTAAAGRRAGGSTTVVVNPGPDPRPWPDGAGATARRPKILPGWSVTWPGAV